MEPEFWHKKWKNREIGFHEANPNSLLVKHFHRLGLARGARLFLPLCGKTRDIDWLLQGGYCVVGAELNETAVGELFQELGVEPQVKELESHRHYRCADIDIFVGDIFNLTPQTLREVDAIYDRAALVALPPETRGQYTAHLQKITSMASQLLITFDYDQSGMDGPPFSVSAAEVTDHYGANYKITTLETRQVEGNLKGQVEATESIRLLNPLRR